MQNDQKRHCRAKINATWTALRLAARGLFYAPSYRFDNTYHGLCYTSRGKLAGTRKKLHGSTMKDRSDEPSHHKRMLLPQSHISLPPLSLVRLNYSGPPNILEQPYVKSILKSPISTTSMLSLIAFPIWVSVIIWMTIEWDTSFWIMVLATLTHFVGLLCFNTRLLFALLCL